MCARTSAEYVGELSGTKEERRRQRRLLDASFKKLRDVLFGADVDEEYLHPEQQVPKPPYIDKKKEKPPHINEKENEEPPHIKDEEEKESLHIKEKEEPKSHHKEEEEPMLCHNKEEEEKEPLHKEKEPPNSYNIKEEDKEYDVTKLALTLRSEDAGKGESEDNREAEPPSSSLCQQMKKDNGDSCGRSQADNLSAPQSECDNISSPFFDTDSGDDEHSNCDATCDTDKERWKCSPGSPQPHGSTTSPDEPNSSSGVNGHVFIRAYQKRSHKRTYFKRHYCLYCSKPYAKMARHLQCAHHDKWDVAEALSFPKRSKERKKQLDYIRNRGNFEHNTAVLKSGKGELVPYKQPPKEAQGSDFMHCAYCQGLFARKVLWRHMHACVFNPASVPPKPGRKRVQSLCSYIGRIPSHASKELWGVISAMNHNSITDIIKNDKVIIDIGQRLLNKGGTSAKNLEYVRVKMREMGRLIANARKVTSCKKFEDLIDPQKYTELTEAVKSTCGYNIKAGKLTYPTLANKLHNTLTEASKLLEAQGLITDNEALVKKATEFQKVHQKRWNELISPVGLRNIKDSRWNMPTLVPFIEDVQKMHIYLNQMGDKHYKCLAQSISCQAWVELSNVCLSQIIIFNRRREAVVANMPLSAFLASETVDPHKNVDWALSEVEKKLCRHFIKIIVMGKHGRPIPILLTPKMLCALQLLVLLRQSCGVLEENKYLFARPGTMTHARASNCLRGHAKLCGVKYSKSITSTRLCKHAATLSTVLNMTDTEMNQLANVLGHDIKVPPEFCRLPQKTEQLAKISKVLMALEQGRLAEFQGQDLDQIEINSHETVIDSSEEDDNTLEEATCSKTEETAPLEEATCSTTIDVTLGKARQKTSTQWSQQEVQAVKKHMSRFITSCIVPGKNDCEECLRADPKALKNRNWKNIKFYVYNRIRVKQRKTLPVCE
ncbi:uncharacterized protein LOC133473276 isoform X1 [Phyllopteryx taeniolatus]|uniref:uncharacterized protein LOC133473276 isoform X1 n=1 Tax=Phyllopteryx taeniolatus TaxID=161469 RepID=UPI002AD328D3|nr:uncharacterized protein LOC133473276 isoform X1 [Phyllopteryx taeniolatus]